MVAARLTSRSGLSVAPRKPTKESKLKESSEDAKLAKDLDRVLRISRPEEVERKPRRAAAATRVPKVTGMPTTTTFKPSAAPLLEKGKSKALAEDVFPWNGADLKPEDRAKLAMQVINDCMKSLSLAAKAGYRHNGDKMTPEWTEEKVTGIVEKCEAALRSVRAQGEKGELGTKLIEVERAAQGLVGKCLSLAMVRLNIQTALRL